MRTLSQREMAAVSGGMDTITVTGTRPEQSWWEKQMILDMFSTDYLSDLYQPAQFGGGGGAPAPEPEAEHDCERSAAGDAASDIAARDAADGKSGLNQPEYGAVIVQTATGGYEVGPIAQGQSYNQANPPATNISIPAGYGLGDVTGVIHSHPATGNSATDTANLAPSDNDWSNADGWVAAGMPADQLTLYIVGPDGVTRAFDYQTPAERGATSANPSGTVTASDGEVVGSGSGGC